MTKIEAILKRLDRRVYRLHEFIERDAPAYMVHREGRLIRKSIIEIEEHLENVYLETKGEKYEKTN